jgi:hypothetical protein
MTAVRLYPSSDAASRAAGAHRLVETWSARPDVQLVRTSARGVIYHEPIVGRDRSGGRVAWFDVTPDAVLAIIAGQGGKPVQEIPFLARRSRQAFANFGITEPLTPRRDGIYNHAADHEEVGRLLGNGVGGEG